MEEDLFEYDGKWICGNVAIYLPLKKENSKSKDKYCKADY